MTEKTKNDKTTEGEMPSQKIHGKRDTGCPGGGGGGGGKKTRWQQPGRVRLLPSIFGRFNLLVEGKKEPLKNGIDKISLNHLAQKT